MTTAHRLCLLVTALLAFGPAAAQERILSFHSDIAIAASGELTVRETIQVNAAGSAIQRGIYRDFPILYRGSAGLRLKVPFEVITVKRNGRDEPFTIEGLGNGRRIRIGSANVLLSPGEHTYEITYRTSEQLGRFAEHDELYWNVTGNGWGFAIDQASARVTLPQGARALSHEAYTGPQGAKGKDYRSAEPTPGVVTFATTSPLPPENGLTIVVTWPKGFLAPPPAQNLTLRYVRDNLGIFGGLLGLLALLVYYVLTWLAVGKDPEKGTIIPRYEPPKGFSPAAVRYLRRMGFDDSTFTAGMIGLAAKGALTIEKDGQVFVLKATPGTPPETLSSEERQLLTKLFRLGNSLRLQQTNHRILGEAKQALQSSLSLALETKYFLRNTGFWILGLLVSALPLLLTALGSELPPVALFLILWLSFWSIGVAVLLSVVVSAFSGRRYLQGVFMSAFALPFVAGELFALSALWLTAGGLVVSIFAITIAAHTAFYHLLKRPTAIGQQTLDEIEGFREYLTVAEADRLNLLNPPQQTPELFEQFLPYAFALDAEQQWSESFDAVLAKAAQAEGKPASSYRPSWYAAGVGAGAFSAAAFSNQLSSAFASAVSSASTAPGSSSGSGGGGSSGGGGGGGGGGGW